MRRYDPGSSNNPYREASKLILSVSSRKIALKGLRDFAKSRFSEFLKELGFERNGDSLISYQYRRRLEQRHDIVEIQFDKYKRPRFILNFGKVPAQGIIDSYGRFVKADKTRISQLVKQGRLYAYPKFTFLENWFGVSWITIWPPEKAAEKQIEKLIRLFPHVDHWFNTDAIRSSNVYIWKWPHNAPGAAKKAMQAKGMWPPHGWTEEDEKMLRM